MLTQGEYVEVHALRKRVEVTAPVDHTATVAFRGNRYSVLPGLAGVTMTLRHKRVLLGSVSDHVVHHCPCPMLVVRRPVDGEPAV